MFHPASSAPHWRKVGNRTAPAPFGSVFQIGLSILLDFVPMDAKIHLLIGPIYFYKRHTIVLD
jgi:hypothetical protein